MNCNKNINTSDSLAEDDYLFIYLFYIIFFFKQLHVKQSGSR